MKQIYCFLLLLCPCFTKAQSTKQLSVGDKVPDIQFTQMVNSKSQTASLSQFKGKLVILDFWATWCSACIKNFPLLDSMQRLHTDKLQVILVNTATTHDTKEKITKLFSRLANTWGRQSVLPVVYNDTVTAKLFPHKYLPHYVWINGKGQCIAITGSGEITAATINAVLQGNTPAFSLKEDMEDFNRKKPLFVNGNGGSGSGIIHRSTFSAYIHGLPSGSSFTKNKNGMVTRIIATNMPVLYLLKSAWQTPIPRNRIIFPGSTKDILDPTGKDDAWITANSYTYELITPPVSWDSAWRLVQQDLKRFSGFSAAVTDRPTDCYILTADTAILALHRSKGGNPVNKLYERDEQYMQNRPVKTLAYYLDGILDKPVVEETGINYTIDLSLSGINGSNFAALQSALLAFGFRLTPSQRILPNFIIYQNYKDNE